MYSTPPSCSKSLTCNGILYPIWAFCVLPPNYIEFWLYADQFASICYGLYACQEGLVLTDTAFLQTHQLIELDIEILTEEHAHFL